VPTEAEQVKAKIASSAVAGVQSASNDSGAVTSMTITDQIKAAQFLSGQSAASKPGNGFGLRFAKIIPSGAG